MIVSFANISIFHQPAKYLLLQFYTHFTQAAKIAHFIGRRLLLEILSPLTPWLLRFYCLRREGTREEHSQLVADEPDYFTTTLTSSSSFTFGTVQASLTLRSLHHKLPSVLNVDALGQGVTL